MEQQRVLPDGRDRQIGLLAGCQGVVWHHRDGSSTLARGPWGLRPPEQVHVKLQLLIGQILHSKRGVHCQHLWVKQIHQLHQFASYCSA